MHLVLELFYAERSRSDGSTGTGSGHCSKTANLEASVSDVSVLLVEDSSSNENSANYQLSRPVYQPNSALRTSHNRTAWLA